MIGVTADDGFLILNCSVILNCVSYPARRLYSIPLPTGGTLELGPRCLVMGILNVTPDSFAESAHLDDPAAAADAALRMEADGADLIDLGGE